MTRFSPTRRAAAIVAFASIVVATGCSSARSINDATPADGAAAQIDSGRSSPATESTEDTAPPDSPTLQELLAQDRFVALAVALERSGLDSVIDGLDEFVLLAPTGAAFASSGADIGIEYSTLMNDARLLEAIMRYHIVVNPSTNPLWRTLNGSALHVVGADPDTIKDIDGVEILDRIPVRNGTVLVMPRILLPASDPSVTSTET